MRAQIHGRRGRNQVIEFTVLSESGLDVFDLDAICAALAPPA